MTTSRHTVRVGPAGWSYKDWEGTVYPPHGSKFDHLAYIAGFFDTAEVNSSFYRIPPVTHSKSWVRRVADNETFRFTTKLYRGFTHEGDYPTDDEVTAFRNYLDPLVEADRFGALLIQFAWSFKNDEDARVRLERVLDDFAAYPCVVEVRHGRFQSDEFYKYLDDRGAGFVNIDQPIFGDSVKPSAVVTGNVAYARLHGRNYQKWFAHEESWERYNYLYEKRELEPWVRRVNEMAEKKDVYVVTNNHFRGQAVVNAVELKQELGQKSEIPPQLKERYPERF